MNVRQIVEKAREFNMMTLLCFVDYTGFIGEMDSFLVDFPEYGSSATPDGTRVEPPRKKMTAISERRLVRVKAPLSHSSSLTSVQSI